MGRQASAEPAQTGHDSDLRELADPEFVARWAAVRYRMALAPAGTPEHTEIKRCYEAVASEYRRRMTGGLADAC
jgi:hypothetical protein